MLALCQAGFQDLLAAELQECGFRCVNDGPGWVRADSSGMAQAGKDDAASAPDVLRLVDDLVFAHRILIAPVEVSGESVNALAQRLAELFLIACAGNGLSSRGRACSIFPRRSWDWAVVWRAWKRCFTNSFEKGVACGKARVAGLAAGAGVPPGMVCCLH